MKTILVVDDSVADRKFMSLVFGEVGYRVLEAESGVEGLNIWKNHPEAIDLIMVDVVMPGMDGVEFFQTVRKLSPQQKVIFVSGFKSQFAVARERATAFVEKSDNTDLFLKKVREILESKESFVDVLRTD